MAGLRKILLVEDNVELSKLYKTFFEYNHYEVMLAVDGVDGLEKAKTFQPDVIFLDIMMPRKDGFEVLKLLRHDPQYGCTDKKIVMLTNLGDGTKISSEVRKDMDGYAVKAEISLGDLLKIIHSFENDGGKK